MPVVTCSTRRPIEGTGGCEFASSRCILQPRVACAPPLSNWTSSTPSIAIVNFNICSRRDRQRPERVGHLQRSIRHNRFNRSGNDRCPAAPSKLRPAGSDPKQSSVPPRERTLAIRHISSNVTSCAPPHSIFAQVLSAVAGPRQAASASRHPGIRNRSSKCSRACSPRPVCGA